MSDEKLREKVRIVSERLAALSKVATAREQDGANDSATVEVATSKPRVRMMFVGGHALLSELEREAAKWGESVHKQFDVNLDITVATPPYEDELDLECMGYWFRIKGSDPEKASQKFQVQHEHNARSVRDGSAGD